MMGIIIEDKDHPAVSILYLYNIFWINTAAIFWMKIYSGHIMISMHVCDNIGKQSHGCVILTNYSYFYLLMMYRREGHVNIQQ